MDNATIELSDKAKAVLATAYPHEWVGGTIWLIDRTLGYKTWASRGKTGARREIAELYRNGLIKELHSPWSSPCYLTPAGKAVAGV
jgi:hypothetical protein